MVRQMDKHLRVFIGSSSEAQEKAKILQELLYEQGDDIEPVAWWSDDAFPVGSTFIESLESVMESTNAALLLATEDDLTVQRGKVVKTARGNIHIEYGLSIKAHGRARTALAVIGNPELPSDLDGVTHLCLEERGNFKERSRGKIRSLVEQWRRTSGNSVFVLAKSTARLKDSKDAEALVNELIKHRDDLLSNTNLVQRYQINRIAIPKLCEQMNSFTTQVGKKSVSQIVTLEEYTDFETKNCWQWDSGYRYQTYLTSPDGTEAVSGVTKTEREALKNIAGVDPRQVSPSREQAVRGVSWYDAAVYCLCTGSRLPTKKELCKVRASARVKDLWEWSQSWFSEEEAHIAVARKLEGHRRLDFIGINPDLRLPQMGFRVIR